MYLSAFKNCIKKYNFLQIITIKWGAFGGSFEPNRHTYFSRLRPAYGSFKNTWTL